MDFFNGAKVVRLRSVHNKYLAADEDENHVRQNSDGDSSQTRWTVHCVNNELAQPRIHLVSCFQRYLTATRFKSFLGLAGKKVRQTAVSSHNFTIFWNPIRVGGVGSRFKLQSRQGGYLWANGGRCPLRCSAVTHNHNVPVLVLHPGWVIWNVEILEMNEGPPLMSLPPTNPPPTDLPQSQAAEARDSLPPSPSYLSENAPAGATDSGRTVSPSYAHIGRSHNRMSLVRRTIMYTVADDNGEIDHGCTWPAFIFRGTSLRNLTARLKEVTKLDDITILTRSPVSHLLVPLCFPFLPVGTRPMRLIVVDNKSNAMGFLLNKRIAFADDIVSVPVKPSPTSQMATSLASTLRTASYVARTGRYKIRYTVTRDLSKINRRSLWFPLIHTESLINLPARLKKETNLDDIFVYWWNPRSESYVPFNPLLPQEEKLIVLAVVDTKSNAVHRLSSNGIVSSSHEATLYLSASAFFAPSPHKVVERGQNNHSTDSEDDASAED